jgi:hypothetical protein
MTLVCHPYKFIYLKTFKTASTSVEGFFEQFVLKNGDQLGQMTRSGAENELGIAGSRGRKYNKEEMAIAGTHGRLPMKTALSGHTSAKSVRELLPSEIWENYYKFCTIRNPFSQLLSQFFNRNTQFMKSDPTKDRIITAFRNWLLEDSNALLNKRSYEIDGKRIVDDAIRFEALPTEIQRVCDHLGIEADIGALPEWRVKTRYRKLIDDYSEFFDTEMIDWVHVNYPWEINELGYSLDQLGNGMEQ